MICWIFTGLIVIAAVWLAAYIAMRLLFPKRWN
jgi:hypothetical protein